MTPQAFPQALKQVKIETPDWDLIQSRVPRAIQGGLSVNLVKRVLGTLQMVWESIQLTPSSPEGIFHLRPTDLQQLRYLSDPTLILQESQEVLVTPIPHLSTMLRAVEISEKGIVVLNKGGNKKDKPVKIAKGLLKEPVRGLFFNTERKIAESVVHATIRYEDRPLLGYTAAKIKKMTENEVRIQRLFAGYECVVQVVQTCTYPSKRKENCPVVEKISITMEDCNEGDLLNALQENEFSEVPQLLNKSKENVLNVVRDMISILEVMEKMDVVHRDLKFENLLLVNTNGVLRLKVADFGMTGLISEERVRLQRAGEGIGGSIEYNCLPAYLRAHNTIADQDETFRRNHMDAIEILCSSKIDVWAMGMILFDFLMGDVPPFAKQFESLDQEMIDEFLDNRLMAENVMWKCLKRDVATQKLLFGLIRSMLQVDPANILPGSELIKRFQLLK